MRQKLAWGMILIAAVAIQSGCKSFPLKQSRQQSTLISQPQPPAEPDQVFVGGAVIDRRPITIPPHGMSLLQVVSQAGIKTKSKETSDEEEDEDEEETDDEDAHGVLMVSLRRETRTGYQLYYFPLRFVLYGSGGEIYVQNADTVQIVSIDSLPSPQANSLPCIIAGLVEAPGQFNVDQNGNKLIDINSNLYTAPLSTAMTVTITRKGTGIGAIESYVIPLTESEFVAGVQFVGGDVITYTQDAGVPILISSYLDKLKRSSKVAKTAARTARILENSRLENPNPPGFGLGISERFQAIAKRTQAMFN